MRALAPLVLSSLLLAQPPPDKLSLAVNDADLRDILRAATSGTDVNLIFDPGLETRVQGLDLKDMSLDELLGQVLPGLGLGYDRDGRNLHIHKLDAGMRFYHVELLAAARTGAKSFAVNASGQVMQAGGGSGGASSSAYTSSVQMAHASDPWADVESGLVLMVFGKPMAQGPATGIGSRSYAADGKTLLIQPNSGLVGVGADPATQARVEAYLREQRQRTQRQVLLEARIVEVTLNNDSQMGVDWNGLLSTNGNQPSASFSTGAALNPALAPASQGVLTILAQSGRVQATLSALAKDNQVKVLSAPRLSTLNNQKAILRVVREDAYSMPSSQITPGTAAGGAVATGQIQPLIVPVGIILDIQPEIGDDGVITLAVNPSISEVVQEKTFAVPNLDGAVQATTTLPVVDRRDLDTVVRIRSGETLVLAGIISTREFTENRGVPWLRSVPLIGQLFSRNEKTRTRTELAIFITPTLMEDAAQIRAEKESAEKRLSASGAQVQPPAPEFRPRP